MFETFEKKNIFYFIYVSCFKFEKFDLIEGTKRWKKN